MSGLTPERPTTDNHDAWKAYWTAQGMSWHTEPEIGEERQQYLAERRAIVPNIEHGLFSFKDIKLDRADVEWLLVTYEEGSGPVNWSEIKSSIEGGIDLLFPPGETAFRMGLDLRGANLCGVNLRYLPLSRMIGGLPPSVGLDAPDERREMAAVHFEGADLEGVQLQGAYLGNAHFEGVWAEWANLQAAHLGGAHLEGAYLVQADLQGADCGRISFEGTSLEGKPIKGCWDGAHLDGAVLSEARLEGAGLGGAYLAGADLSFARLDKANLSDAHLEGRTATTAEVERVRKWQKPFLDPYPWSLPPANLQRAVLGAKTVLDDAILGDGKDGVALADIRWNGVDLTRTDWTRVRILGDEQEAREKTYTDGTKIDTATRLEAFRTAIRANRQLATVLRNQGLNEEADNFAYRAQMLQRHVLRRQRRYGSALGSWLLDVIAGHGYKPNRTLTVYLLAIISFAVAYFALGRMVGPKLSPVGAFVFSMTSFHGRGFFPGGIALDDPITVLAAFEAFVGLVIEITFIATFTQRFFAR